MKTFFLRVMIVLFAGLTMSSCVEDDNYTVPVSLGNEENNVLQVLIANSSELTIAEVKARYLGDQFIEQETTKIYVKGYVSSSDQTGNFFKEFFIQDSPTDPTIALKVILSEVDTYNQFNKGREVYINLEGLYIGEERVGNGVITIGGGTETDQYGTTVTSLSINQKESNVLRSENTFELTPLATTFSQINSSHVGIYVEVDNVEFATNLDGLRYFDPAQDYDTARTMQACEGFSYANFQLETSSFADFRDELLPTLNGTIAGIVNKTYDGSSLVLALNTLDDVNINNERCTLLDIDDFSPVLVEDFNSAVNNTNLDFPGWTNFAEEGTWVWREKTFSGNGYAEFSSYNSGVDVNIAWMITPGIDMDAQDNEYLNFKSAQHHLESPNNTFEVFVSTDYNGTDVLSATWEPISAALASQSNSWYDFVDSGLIDLSSYSGTLYVAFKVVGSGNDTMLDGGYQIDDFSIIASN